MTRRIVQIELLKKVRSELAALSCQTASGAWVVVWSDALSLTDKLIAEAEDTPVDPDPIAELEGMGGYLCANHEYETGDTLGWYIAGRGESESVGQDVNLSDLRAAAARLLERVRGTSRGQVPYLEATGGSECGASLEEQAEESKT